MGNPYLSTGGDETASLYLGIDRGAFEGLMLTTNQALSSLLASLMRYSQRRLKGDPILVVEICRGQQLHLHREQDA